MRTAIVSGAGVAGATVAYWLDRYGWPVTLLERAETLRSSGQNVDIRGAGRDVIRRMGLDERVAASSTGEVGTRFIDARGRTVAEFPAGTGDTDGPTAEREILRGQLVTALDELVPARVERHYGDRITAVTQHPDRVEVVLEHGGRRHADVLVIAEGIRSDTRDLALPGQTRIRDLGQYIAYGAIPRADHDDKWWNWLPAGRGRAVMLRPDNVGTTRASLACMASPDGLERLPAGRQLARLRDLFADDPWQARRILDALTADHSDFYLDRVAQVHLATWTSGRIAVVGDAAYCPSPISGMGTTLALAGAYILAGELTTWPNHRDALRRYEQRMRQYVTRAQKLPPGTPRIANPTTRAGVALLNTGLRLAASRPARALGARLFAPPADTLHLPEYAAV
ncbi:FAD-dependent monooxygenase [Dactylosporangium vinaceum]|uniref:FAD-dependent monooxygenase n=1 Tax=Dactylosporangium vinaceum TaxID=53362 RepID=A0ABV5MAL2_9ACTN|nr:FAD-dependent monooxygenase [Dactylosporangium vinaceum]UAB92945.1 FAD-dependent monooxygenase [Dactylosporangium vinaceum]